MSPAARLLRALALVLALAFSGLAFGGSALAVQPDEVLADPALEARARAISKDVRCPICRSENIDDSDAPIAKDLRVLIRERLTAGDSDGEIKDFLVARYGDFILLKPRFSPRTAMLWLGPLAALGLGLILARGVLRRRPGLQPEPEPPAPLSPEDQARLRDLLGEPQEPPKKDA